MTDQTPAPDNTSGDLIAMVSSAIKQRLMDIYWSMSNYATANPTDTTFANFFYAPMPKEGWKWVQAPINHWWSVMNPPFVCYSRPDMEHFIDVLASETDAAPKLRVVTYQMTVSAISTNGLRFKVFSNPEMWVLGEQTQPTQ